jgi:cytochrome P450
MIEATAERKGGQHIHFDPSLRAWLVSDAASARIVLSQHTLFGTEGYQVLDPDLSDIRRFQMAPANKHRLLRRMMTRAFSARRISAIDAAVLRPAAEDLAVTLPGSGRVELQTRYVTPYTRRAMYGVIGIGRRRGDALTAAFRVCHGFWEQQRDRERGLAALHLLRQRAAAICVTSDDERLPSSLLGMAEREHWLAYLEVEDLVCLIMPLVEAVAVKVHRDLTATLLRRVAAMSAAEQTRLLRTDGLVEAADEAVRLQRGGFLPRMALVDIKLGEQTIRAGDRVYVMLGNVGVDPTAFADPERFCPWRSDRKNAVSFGIGLHRCVGENIAKQIAVRACRSLLDRWWLTLVDECPTTFDVALKPWP